MHFSSVSKVLFYIFFSGDILNKVYNNVMGTCGWLNGENSVSGINKH